MVDATTVGTGAVGGAAAGSALGPWGAVAGAVLGGASSFFGGSAAEKARKRQIKKLMQMYAKLGLQQRAASQAALAELQGARADLLQGYRGGAQAIARGSRQAEIAAQDELRRGISATVKQMQSTGRYSSSMADMARMGMAGWSARVVSDIAAKTSQALAGMRERRGASLAGSRAAIAAQHNISYQQVADITQNVAEIQGADIPAATDYSTQIGQLIGAIAPLFTPKQDTSVPASPSPLVGTRSSTSPTFQGPVAPSSTTYPAPDKSYEPAVDWTKYITPGKVLVR